MREADDTCLTKYPVLEIRLCRLKAFTGSRDSRNANQAFFIWGDHHIVEQQSVEEVA